jgi:hypothetical protein
MRPPQLTKSFCRGAKKMVCSSIRSDNRVGVYANGFSFLQMPVAPPITFFDQDVL